VQLLREALGHSNCRHRDKQSRRPAFIAANSVVMCVSARCHVVCLSVCLSVCINATATAAADSSTALCVVRVWHPSSALAAAGLLHRKTVHLSETVQFLSAVINTALRPNSERIVLIIVDEHLLCHNCISSFLLSPKCDI